jgi:ribokinase
MTADRRTGPPVAVRQAAGHEPASRASSAAVVVLGAINVDMVVSGAPLPAPGETVVGGVFSMHHGGKGGNQAVAAARALRGGPLDGRVAMVGAVGDDAFGREALAALEAEGVDCSAICVRAGMSTGVALIVVDDHGENQIAVAPGANATLAPADVEAALSRVMGPGSVLLASLEVPADAVLAAAYVARTVGAPVVLNPAPARDVPPALLRLASHITPNETEIDLLVPGFADDPAAAAHRLAVADRELRIAVTLGARGVMAIGPDVEQVFRALEVDPIDTVGAGDAYNGAFAAALAEGRPFVEAVRRGRTAGGLATTRQGAREGMPTRDEIDRAREPR